MIIEILTFFSDEFGSGSEPGSWCGKKVSTTTLKELIVTWCIYDANDRFIISMLQLFLMSNLCTDVKYVFFVEHTVQHHWNKFHCKKLWKIAIQTISHDRCTRASWTTCSRSSAPSSSAAGATPSAGSSSSTSTSSLGW